MIKKTHLILLISYVAIILYLAIFNWKLFFLPIDISIGLTDVRFPLVALIAFIGLVVVVTQWLMANYSLLKYQRDVITKEKELLEATTSTDKNAPSALKPIKEEIEKLHQKLDQLLNPSSETKELSKDQ
ncbi:MAG: hypothetical protein D6748_03545 [Calditrichaeota bacterium]|nr:MAG: hypothetical protein D6748_03545 [Calditrichota bacterium]